jgi:hypothetical protein
MDDEVKRDAERKLKHSFHASHVEILSRNNFVQLFRGCLFILHAEHSSNAQKSRIWKYKFRIPQRHSKRRGTERKHYEYSEMKKGKLIWCILRHSSVSKKALKGEFDERTVGEDLG